MPGVSIFPINDVPLLSLFLNFYGYYLPFFLYATWTSLALMDISQSRYSSNVFKVSWTLVVTFIPLIGSFVYHLFIAEQIHVAVRATMIFGGIIIFTGVIVYLGFAL
jgi:hypothetical protein